MIPRMTETPFISPNPAAALRSVFSALRSAAGNNKSRRIVQRLMPDLVFDMLVGADDRDRGSPADVIPLLREFLPENKRTRQVVLFHKLLAIIRHGDDDNGHHPI